MTKKISRFKDEQTMFVKNSRKFGFLVLKLVVGSILMFYIKLFRYFEAIGKQSLACPKICLRRQMIDTIQSPSPCAIMSSMPLHPSDISKTGIFFYIFCHDRDSDLDN